MKRLLVGIGGVVLVGVVAVMVTSVASADGSSCLMTNVATGQTSTGPYFPVPDEQGGTATVRGTCIVDFSQFDELVPQQAVRLVGVGHDAKIIQTSNPSNLQYLPSYLSLRNLTADFGAINTVLALELNQNSVVDDSINVLVKLTMNANSRITAPVYNDDSATTTMRGTSSITGSTAGGIDNLGTVVMQGRSSITGNTTSGNGGGVKNESASSPGFSANGTLIMDGMSSIRNNTAGEHGGGVYNANGAKLVMRGRSQVVDNSPDNVFNAP